MTTSAELLFMSAVIRTGDYKSMNMLGITPQMFHRYPEEGRWLFTYVLQHSKAPSKAAFRSAWPDMKFYAVDDVEYYSQQLKKEHARDGVMNMLDQAVAALEYDDPDKVIAVIQASMADVQTRSMGMSADYDAFADWRETYNEVSARVARVRNTGFAGVPSGFPTLDGVTGGFQPGWLSIVGARLGMGKTWSLVRMAFAATVTRHTSLYYSLEQNRHQVAMRMHSFASRAQGQKVFNSLDLSKGNGFDLRAYRKFLEKMQANNTTGRFLINDSSRGTVTPSIVAAGIEKNKPDIVMIDYLTLMGTSGEDWRSTAKLSAELQSVCQRYMIPIVAASQVNRLGIGKEPPGAENLSQADAIGQDADIVMTMTQISKHVMKLRLAKFRHGPGGMMWYCRFSPGTGQYDEITGDEAEEQKEKDQEVE